MSKFWKNRDLAVILPNGYGQIVGRIKDMVIRGGENLYPREIEEMLHTHPDVLEAYVIGVPDERLGEELCAWVRGDVTKEGLRQFCKGRVRP
jgi:fatty-acyl-CoA synthase